MPLIRPCKDLGQLETDRTPHTGLVLHIVGAEFGKQQNPICLSEQKLRKGAEEEERL